LVALFALVLGLAQPPSAYIQAGSARVPLAISSWCWGARCGAPISASTRVAVVRRGTTVRAQLAFAPTRARLAIGGRPVAVATHGDVLSWRAGSSGGLTLNVDGGKGWVIYVVRLTVRPG
jgi:hypothetical protein